LNTHGKNESEVPKELVTFLKYVKADLAGSEEAFDDSYVEQLQNFIRKIKGSREMEERFMIFEEMLKEERAEGFAKGREEGLQEGRSTLKETLLLFLQSFGDIPDEVLEQIQAQQDMEVLKNWMQTAFRSKTLEEFVQKM
jgi:flagellar biosynthesis/type III secretory pathway protein FliH